MAKLTDLPNEILSLIFRQFLSKSLTDHDHLCEWNVEHDAVSRRANLYNLALVCKSLAKVSLPLLYEQLFRYGDIRTYIASNVNPDSASTYLGRVRYLVLDFDTKDDRQIDTTFLSTISAYLPHFVRLQHLSIGFRDFCPEASRLLHEMGSLPTNKMLQSVGLILGRRDSNSDNCTVLNDLCMFSNLTGLFIHLCGEPYSLVPPPHRLQCLKELRIQDVRTSDDAVACMSMAAPAIVHAVAVTLAAQNNSEEETLFRVFAQHRWVQLEHLNIYGGNGPAYKGLPLTSCLPGLRNLVLEYANMDFDTEMLPVLPGWLESLTIESITMDELVDILSSIRDRTWPEPYLQRIRLDLNDLESYGWENDEVSEDSVLKLTSEAILAAQARGMRLEPDDLVDRLKELEGW